MLPCFAGTSLTDLELNAFQELERRFSRVPKSELDVACGVFFVNHPRRIILPTCISNLGKIQKVEEELPNFRNSIELLRLSIIVGPALSRSWSCGNTVSSIFCRIFFQWRRLGNLELDVGKCMEM